MRRVVVERATDLLATEVRERLRHLLQIIRLSHELHDDAHRRARASNLRIAAADARGLFYKRMIVRSGSSYWLRGRSPRSPGSMILAQLMTPIARNGCDEQSLTAALLSRRYAATSAPVGDDLL
jgi:hypothetical protein